ncbi:hypothetical protein H4R18_004435 [Coemansia javaensis]|uniref:Sjogrens syndrome scleroderma autoantigen 1 n=1 Tax=Coemansia javaensis TaxID=2761396 RepID=A0A9W8LG94_9FUNG|nr:hypothetical protein H4R18_004435 [Coemansia javaensis]
MPSMLDTVTGRLSGLMLKRWTMLAEMCPVDGCSVPLMRSPETSEEKCVLHDAAELFPDEEPACAPAAPREPAPAVERADEKLDGAAKEDRPAAEGGDEEAQRQRRRRREQGDLASERIGKRLLQGWAMIDRPCPADGCYNVPLVQDRDKVQECVICGQRYMDEEAYVAKYGSTRAQEEPPVPAAEPDPAKKPGPPARDPAPTGSPVPAGPRARTEGGVAVAIDALNSKIAALSARLAAATDLADIVRVGRAIAVCAKAIRACQKC